MFSSVLQSDISLIAQALNPEKHRTWQWWLTGKHMLEKDNRDSQRLLWRKRSSECCQLILIQQKSWISKTFFFPIFPLFFTTLCFSVSPVIYTTLYNIYTNKLYLSGYKHLSLVFCTSTFCRRPKGCSVHIKVIHSI